MQTAGSDKRKFKRSKYLRTVEIVVGANVVKGAAMDLSKGGIGVLTDTPLPVTDCVVRNRTLLAKGKIVYREEKNGIIATGPVFRYGIVFLTNFADSETYRLLTAT